MRLSLPLLITATALALAGCAGDNEELADDLSAVVQDQESTEEDPGVRPVPVEVSTELLDPEGSEVGMAWFRDDDDRAMVEVQVAGLTRGFHPMYLYGTGTCDADDLAAGDAVLRELPALLVLENGVGSMSTLAGSMSLDSLLADQGTALVVGPAVETLADVPALPDEDIGSFISGSQVACGAIDG